MRKAKFLSSLILLIVLVAGCKRPDDSIGGKGGETTLKITPQHHGKNIDSCTIYIKYNADTPPSETTVGYDESITCVMESGNPVATFTELKKGKYYIYGYGWDSNISQNVKGGIPFTISEEGVLNVVVPVSED